MKTYTIVAAGLLLASVSVMGQPAQEAKLHAAASTSLNNEQYLQKAVRTYTQLLNSTTDGFVTSAIAHLTYIRISMPDMDMNGVQSKVIDLAKSGRTPAVRYKAYLASMVFQSPEMFRCGSMVESTENDLFFREIASKAQTALLGQNSR